MLLLHERKITILNQRTTKILNISGVILNVAGVILSIAGAILNVAGAILNIAGAILNPITYDKINNNNNTSNK